MKITHGRVNYRDNGELDAISRGSNMSMDPTGLLRPPVEKLSSSQE